MSLQNPNSYTDETSLDRANRRDIRRYLLVGIVVVVALFGGLGGWAALASIHGAVIASGTVVVDTYSKKVQHFEGGIIAEIAVRDGDFVEAGQLLVRLDETDTRANLEIVIGQLIELEAQRARLFAERDGLDQIEFVSQFDVPQDEKHQQIWNGQQRLLKARLDLREGRAKQLHERINQLGEAIKGLSAQRESKKSQSELIKAELDVLIGLEKKKLVKLNRLLALKREAAKLQGEHGQIIADIARTKVQIGETELKLLEIDQSVLSEVLTELREVETKIAELSERRSIAQAKIGRTRIVAPNAGYIHNLSTHTVGGVIAPGEPIVEIVPRNDLLVIESRVALTDIDQVADRQMAIVRLTAFEQRATPELEGKVINVSADAKQDRDGTPPYYLVRVRLSEGELAKLEDKILVPGMPVEVFIQTGARTVLSFLTKPLMDQLRHAMREG